MRLTINTCKSRLDKFWQDQDMIYDFQAELHRSGRARVKCELRNCEWVFRELKCEPARDWSAIFRTTRSLPGVNTIAHNRNLSYRKQDMHTRTHNTCVCHVRYNNCDNKR